MKKIIILMSVISILILIISNSHFKKNVFKYAIKEECMAIINTYVEDSDKYNSYLIMPTGMLFNHENAPLGYLIGPLYKGIENEIDGFNPVSIMKIKGKRIYLYSDISDLIFLGTDTIMKYCPKDSVIISRDNKDTLYTEYILVNYLKRARMFYKCRGRFFINNSPDTLFLPKINMEYVVEEDTCNSR